MARVGVRARAVYKARSKVMASCKNRFLVEMERKGLRSKDDL